MTITITPEQIEQISNTIGKRWTLENFGNYYNIIDTKTGQHSNNGGDYNFASYHMKNAIETAYLNLIGKNSLYLDWQTSGVDETNKRKSYISCIVWKVEELLCGFTDDARKAATERIMKSIG